jgi:hypothetical protein
MTGYTQAPGTIASLLYRWRFAAVLVASLMLATAPPLMSSVVDDDSSFVVLFSLLIAAVMLQVFEERGLRRWALALGLAAVGGQWVSRGLSGEIGRWLLVADYLLAAVFFAVALYGILRAILSKQLSGDAIFGAVCGYLLLGIIWSLLYFAVELAWPGSFGVPATGASEAASVHPDRGILNYYSFITLATVGYGDVTPLTPLARTLAWMEAVIGQFYLAILVSGLVGYQVSHGARNDASAAPRS